MRKEDLFDAVGKTDTDLLLKSEQYTEKSGKKWWNKAWMAAGAPLAIAAVILGVLMISLPVTDKTPMETPVQILETESSFSLLSEHITKENEYRNAAAQAVETSVYDEIMEMLGDGYEDLTVAQAAQKLVPWVEENRESVLPVITSMMKRQVQNDRTSVNSNHYLSRNGVLNTTITVASVLQDAANIVMEHSADSVWQSNLMEKTVDLTLDSRGGYILEEVWVASGYSELMVTNCDWNVSFSYHVSEPEVLTVSERNDKIRKMTTTTEAYLRSMSNAELFFVTEEEIRAELHDAAERCSNEAIQFYFGEDQIYFYRTISGGNAIDLNTDFDMITLETEPGEKIEITKASARYYFYDSFRTQWDVTWMDKTDSYQNIEEYMTVFDRGNLEKRESIMKFWIDDMECELFEAYLRIGTDWYYLGNSQVNVSKSMKYMLDRLLTY